MYSESVWKPPLEICSSDEKCAAISERAPRIMSSESPDRLAGTNRLTISFICSAMKDLAVDMIPTPHFQDLYIWMNEQLASERARTVSVSDLERNGKGITEPKPDSFPGEAGVQSIEC